MSKSKPLQRLLSPKSIAVFGGNAAAEVIRQCRKLGFAGELWPVHPTRKEVEGLPCFASVAELPAAPDAAFVAVPAQATVEVVAALSARGAGGAICYASGFAEVGGDGVALQQKLVQAAGNMALIGPNCYGLLNYLDGVALWPDQHGGKRLEREAGVHRSGCGVAIITQSGNIGLNLTMQRRGLPLAYLITVGNKAGDSMAPTAPVYYVAVSAGYRDFGGVKNGERAIPRQLVNETMLKVLAKQGYLPVPQDQHPDIALVWTWGTLNVERTGMSLGVGNSQINRQQMLRFMGGDKVGLTSEFGDPFPEQTLKLGLVFDGSDVRDLPDVARHDLYVAVINAYDVKLNDLNHGVLLWNTRISCPSRGYWLSEALPAMLVMASPNIGRETTLPVWLRATERFKPEVKLGDLKVVEYLENNRQAVVETGPSS